MLPAIESTPAGDSDAAANEALFAALYNELHGIARRELARAGGAGSLGVTTLLHEAYLGMSAREGLAFPDRARFMAYASRVMRGLIINYAKNKRAAKRGGQFEILSLATDVEQPMVDAGELAEINDALDQLAKTHPSLAEVVDLKFFGGFSFPEIAAMRQISERTVQRDWEKARTFLYQALGHHHTI